MNPVTSISSTQAVRSAAANVPPHGRSRSNGGPAADGLNDAGRETCHGPARPPGSSQQERFRASLAGASRFADASFGKALPPMEGLPKISAANPQLASPDSTRVFGSAAPGSLAVSELAGGALRLYQRAQQGSRSLTTLTARCAHGKSLRPQELISLQAQVYQGVESMQLFAKTLETGSSATRQLLGTQL